MDAAAQRLDIQRLTHSLGDRRKPDQRHLLQQRDFRLQQCPRVRNECDEEEAFECNLPRLELPESHRRVEDRPDDGLLPSKSQQ